MKRSNYTFFSSISRCNLLNHFKKMDLLVEGPLSNLKPCTLTLPQAVKIPSRYHTALPAITANNQLRSPQGVNALGPDYSGAFFSLYDNVVQSFGETDSTSLYYGNASFAHNSHTPFLPGNSAFPTVRRSAQIPLGTPHTSTSAVCAKLV